MVALSFTGLNWLFFCHYLKEFEQLPQCSMPGWNRTCSCTTRCSGAWTESDLESTSKKSNQRLACESHRWRVVRKTLIWAHAQNVVENFTVVNHLGKKKVYFGTCYKYEIANSSICLWIKAVFTILAATVREEGPISTLSFKGQGDVAWGWYHTRLSATHMLYRVSYRFLPDTARMEENTISLGHKRAKALTLKL